MTYPKFLFWAILFACLGGCASYDSFRYITEEFEIPGQTFKAKYEQTWQAIVQVVKPYDLAYQNQETGTIKTHWIDNTMERNFQESFQDSETVKAARFKLTIRATKSMKGNTEVTKVSIYKRQLVEQDFLQGWKEVPPDGIQERIMLYRMERLIKIDNQLQEIDKQKEKEAEQNLDNPAPST
jgi:hypothetical protein